MVEAIHAMLKQKYRPPNHEIYKKLVANIRIYLTVTANEILYFPEMSERDLTIFFTGSYQISQAVSYLAEMLNKDGKLPLQYVKEEPNVLKFEVKSRHIS